MCYWGADSGQIQLWLCSLGHSRSGICPSCWKEKQWNSSPSNVHTVPSENTSSARTFKQASASSGTDWFNPAVFKLLALFLHFFCIYVLCVCPSPLAAPPHPPPRSIGRPSAGGWFQLSLLRSENNCSLTLAILTFCMSARLLTTDWFQAPFWLQDSLIRIHFKRGWTSKIESISVSEICSEPLRLVSPPLRHTYRCGRGAYWERFRLPSECSQRDDVFFNKWRALSFCSVLAPSSWAFMHHLLEFNWIQLCCAVFVTLLMVMIARMNTSMKLIHSKWIQRFFFLIFKL